MGYSHGKKWTEQEIIEKVQHLVKTLGIKTFPTHSQMNEFYNSCALSNAISKRGGTKKYADFLGLEIKKSESSFGESLEEYCAMQIEEKLNLICEKTNSRHPYDILVDKSVKIDVKAGRLFDNYGGAKYYSFNLEKKEQTCDIFVFYCIGENQKIEKTLIIPSFVLSGKTQLAIGKNATKYDEYKDKWLFIEKYHSFISNCV